MKIILYSHIHDVALFTRVGFYRDDIVALKSRNDTVIASNSIKEIIRIKPNLLVCYFYSKSFFAALIGRALGANVIFTGGADQICPSLVTGFSLNFRRLLAFSCLLIAHKVLVSCTDDYINFKKLAFGIPFLKRKINQVPHVVMPSQLISGKKNDPSDSFDAFTLAWMGSIGNVKRKGVDRAIALISVLRKKGVNANLRIAGTTGPGTDYLIKDVAELDIVEHIQFLGAISEDEKNKIYTTCNVYLQLSDHEGFGVAAAEAFFSGMTVVHSNVGGLRDVIGSHGLILLPSAIDEMHDDAINNFYNQYLSYVPNKSYLQSEINKYSISARSCAFFGVKNVQK